MCSYYYFLLLGCWAVKLISTSDFFLQVLCDQPTTRPQGNACPIILDLSFSLSLSCSVFSLNWERGMTSSYLSLHTAPFSSLLTFCRLTIFVTRYDAATFCVRKDCRKHSFFFLSSFFHGHVYHSVHVQILLTDVVRFMYLDSRVEGVTWMNLVTDTPTQYTLWWKTCTGRISYLR